MLADSLLVPECVFRPGSFTGLMTLYESNFIKLAGLIEPLAAQRPKQLEPAVSVTPNDCDLHLRPVSFERYTTTIKLTYWFDVGPSESGTALAIADGAGAPGTAAGPEARTIASSATVADMSGASAGTENVVERIADPDLMVRIYHDARLVEAVRGADSHQHHKLQELASQEFGGVHSLELDRRWRNNIMLNKWLDYVLDMGHRFR